MQYELRGSPDKLADELEKLRRYLHRLHPCLLSFHPQRISCHPLKQAFGTYGTQHEYSTILVPLRCLVYEASPEGCRPAVYGWFIRCTKS